MIGIGLFGCGRIGRMHAGNIAANAEARLVGVCDVDAGAAEALARVHACTAAETPQALLGRPDLDAVLIASSTDTHADLMELAAAAGKGILCEKPIDLSLARVERCAAAIADYDVPIQIGFNRRFDPGHRAARAAADAGEIGDLHQVIITSRDPEIPPVSYLRVAGGLMRDMTIHDFDLARFMLAEEPTAVFAIAGALGDPVLGAELNEVDTTMIILRTDSGRMCHINNSRAAAYGYDQRVELFGNKGMLISGNRRAHELQRFTAKQTEAGEPCLYFFIERYQEAFRAELDSFINAVANRRPCEVGFADGRQALVIAEAAYESLSSGRMVAIAPPP